MILLLALIASLQISADSTNQLVGTWLNHDSSTLGVTQIVISNENGVLRAHAWGACEPADCDWGPANLTFEQSTATALFYTGPIQTTMYLTHLPNDKLLAVYKTEAGDRPDYHDQDHMELFEREKLNSNDQSARTLLKAVSEKYSSLTTAEFDFDRTFQSSDQISVTRSKSNTHMLLAAQDNWRTETTGAAEPTVNISDGKTFWTYFPESNQYTAYPLGEEANSLVQLYGSIDQVRGTPNMTGSEHIGDVDCKVVKIERPDSVRTLWIDPKTNFILKDDSTTTKSFPTGVFTVHSVTIFSLAQVLPGVDQQLFSFDPQKLNAKPRQELRQQAKRNSVGTHAPNFTLSDLEHQPLRLSDLKGKVVLLDFWATWCRPCREALPAIELLHREFKDKGLVVLGVDDEDSPTQTTFLDKFGYTFRSLVDPMEQVKNLFHVSGFPTTVLIDKQGTIQVFELGGASYDSLRDAIRKIGIS
jgi:peroxiredoxin/outer membrane lipoprotein-sorting protein